MQKTIRSAVHVSLCALLAVGTLALAQDAKVDATGKWSWVSPGRDGGPGRTNLLTLKVEGEKLTGKISTPWRDGQVRETDIAEGKVKAGEISFTVTREFNGNKMVSKYNGKLTADTIKGKIEFDRQGQTQTRDWEAKRQVDKK